MDRTRRVYSILFSLVALWCGMILAAPLLQGVSDSSSSVLYQFFSRICHQLDERSFHLAGGKLAVCIRCSAIYFGFLAGVTLYPLIRNFSDRKIPPLHWLYLATAPMLVDVVFSVTGIHASTDATRLVTGGLLGLALPSYILPLLFEAISTFWSKNSASELTSEMKGATLYARKTE